MGIEEFLDVTPWDGLRIGTIEPPPDSSLERIMACDREWCVALSSSGLDVKMDGRSLLASTSPIVLRQVVVDETNLRAEISSLHSTTLSVSLGAEEVVLTLDGVETTVPATAVCVPAGQHIVSIAAAPDTIK